MAVKIKTYGQDAGEVFRQDLRENSCQMKDGYVFLMTTEEIDFCRTDSFGSCSEDQLEALFQRGLEIRIFDRDREIKWFRTGIDRCFSCRERADDLRVLEDPLHWWDESQYLDIDEKHSGDFERTGKVRATGGGEYTLPAKRIKDVKIEIRNYLGEDPDTGELYVEDWRLVGLT